MDTSLDRPHATRRPAGAVQYLRRLTLARATLGNVRWLVGTHGWGTFVYAAIVAAITVVGAVQSLNALEPANLPAEYLPVIAAIGALGVVLHAALASGTPPVILDRRDVIRVGLAPLRPADALRWPLLLARLKGAATGAVAGALWSLVAPALFGVSAPWAAVALALLFSLRVDVAWTAYCARFRAARERAAGGLLLGVNAAGALVVAGLLGPVGLGSALYRPEPLALLGPLVLTALAFVAAQRTRQDAYPDRFVAHSRTLGQLRALAFGGLMTQSPADADLQRRLRLQLRDHRSAVRPSRSLRPPPARRGPAGALAWRGALRLARRPIWMHLLIASQLAALTAALPLAAGSAFGPLLLCVPLALLAQNLLAPLPGGTALPIPARARTAGRVAAGASLVTALAAFGLPGLLLGGMSAHALALLLAALQVILTLTVLERVTASLGAALQRETPYGVALLCTLPGVWLAPPLALAVTAALAVMVLGAHGRQ